MHSVLDARLNARSLCIQQYNYSSTKGCWADSTFLSFFLSTSRNSSNIRMNFFKVFLRFLAIAPHSLSLPPHSVLLCVMNFSFYFNLYFMLKKMNFSWYSRVQCTCMVTHNSYIFSFINTPNKLSSENYVDIFNIASTNDRQRTHIFICRAEKYSLLSA